MSAAGAVLPLYLKCPDDRAVKCTQEGLTSLRVPELKSLAIRYGLRTGGRKQDLVDRLLHLARRLGSPDAFKEALRTTAPVDAAAVVVTKVTHDGNDNFCITFGWVCYDKPPKPAASAGATGQRLPLSIPYSLSSEPLATVKVSPQQQAFSIYPNSHPNSHSNSHPSAKYGALRNRACPFTAEAPLTPFFNCLCGGTPANWSAASLIIYCAGCHLAFHGECLRFTGCTTTVYSFVCPRCRLLEMDPFYPVQDILWSQYVHNGGRGVCSTGDVEPCWRITYSDVFERVPAVDREKYEVVLYGVRLYTPGKQPDWYHLDWPFSLDVVVNQHVEQIMPPHLDNKRRDTPVIVGTMLRTDPANNDGRITAYLLQAEKDFYAGPFFLALCLTRRVSPKALLSVAHSRPEAGAEVCRERAAWRLSAAADDEDVEAVSTAATLKLICPISLQRIELPARGVNCKHLQCFDAASFLHVNLRTRAFNSRWKCPEECGEVIRPSDLVVDAFIKNLLEAAPASVDLLEVKRDLSWRPIRQVAGGSTASDSDDNEDKLLFLDNSDAQSRAIRKAAPAEIEDLTLDSDDDSGGDKNDGYEYSNLPDPSSTVPSSGVSLIDNVIALEESSNDTDSVVEGSPPSAASPSSVQTVPLAAVAAATAETASSVPPVLPQSSANAVPSNPDNSSSTVAAVWSPSPPTTAAGGSSKTATVVGPSAAAASEEPSQPLLHTPRPDKRKVAPVAAPTPLVLPVSYAPGGGGFQCVPPPHAFSWQQHQQQEFYPGQPGGNQWALDSRVCVGGGMPGAVQWMLPANGAQTSMVLQPDLQSWMLGHIAHQQQQQAFFVEALPQQQVAYPPAAVAPTADAVGVQVTKRRRVQPVPLLPLLPLQPQSVHQHGT